METKDNPKKQNPEILPNNIPPETPPIKPEKGTEQEKNDPFNPCPEVNPLHEPKTYPDKR